MIACNSCHKEEGRYHVTLNVSIFGPSTERLKHITLWLCDACEKNSREVLAKDFMQAERVARALTWLPDKPGRAAPLAPAGLD